MAKRHISDLYRYIFMTYHFATQSQTSYQIGLLIAVSLPQHRAPHALQHLCYQQLFRACLVHQVTAGLCYADCLHKTTQPRSCSIIFSTQEEEIKSTIKLTGKWQKSKLRRNTERMGKVPSIVCVIYKHLGENCYNFIVWLKSAVESK